MQYTVAELKAINVWIFVILWPILTLALIAILVAQHLKIRRLLKQAENNVQLTNRSF